MKEIKAIIRPNKLAALRDALRVLEGFPGMTVTKVEGCSAPVRVGMARGIRDELTEYTPKVRVELVAPDELAQAIVDCIIKVGQSGAVGDGIVWVTDVERSVFIHKSGPSAVD
jgi:nitrogen regulatory protein P-II 1